MSGDIPPLPNTLSWRDAQLKLAIYEDPHYAVFSGLKLRKEVQAIYIN